MLQYIYNFYRAVMFLTPEALLSNTSREQCITKLNELPPFIKDRKRQTNAAVLVPICVVNNEVCILYTLRSSNLSSHSGQVSFPGGKMDEGENVYDTALRETEEEIGFLSKDVDIWNKMSPVQGRDQKVVITPVVGLLKNFDMNKLRRSENEVAEIFTVPIRVFCDKENHASIVFNNFNIPVFLGGKHKVWGITGLITHLFLESFLSQDIYQGNFLKKIFTIDELMPSKL